MSTNSDIIKVGEILIAKPFIPELTYQHSVILIGEIDEKGISGLIINRESSLQFKEIFSDFHSEKDQLYYGGAIQNNLITFLHNIDQVKGGTEIENGLFWGGDPKSIKKSIEKNPFYKEKIRFYAGYTAWRTGELESELKNNFWWKTKLSHNELFKIPVSHLYDYLLKRDHILYDALIDLPAPNYN